MNEDIVKQIAKIADAFEKHGYDDLRHFSDIGATLKRIEIKTDEQTKILAPIANTYRTITTFGKWLLPFTVFISLVVGIIWGILQIIFHR